MSGRRASLSDAHDPRAARFWRVVTIALFGLAAWALLTALLFLVLDWGPSLRVGGIAVVGIVFGVLAFVGSAFCIQAIEGPADPERPAEYPQTWPTLGGGIPMGCEGADFTRAVGAISDGVEDHIRRDGLSPVRAAVFRDRGGHAPGEHCPSASHDQMVAELDQAERGDSR